MVYASLKSVVFFAALAAARTNSSKCSSGKAAIDNMKAHIKNVVLLVMENRSFDNILGGQTLKGLDNPYHNGPFCNPYNLTEPTRGEYCGVAKDYDSIADDPDHAVYGNNIEFYGTFNPSNDDILSGKLVANQKGFVHEQLRLYDADVNQTTLSEQVMNFYTEDQVPVLTSLVQNFVTFNYWHSSIPGPTCPNRMSIVAGSSFGHGINDDAFSDSGFNETGIFQSLTERGYDWRNYYDPVGGTGPEASWFSWTFDSGNDNKIVELDQFYIDAAAGNLTSFSILNPSCCGEDTTSMHPTGLVSLGEGLIKDVYDALRGSPQWEETLFILTYDESGGFYDHVAPSLAPRPDNLTYTATTPAGEDYTFNFDRLGGRMPTFLISPWVDAGFVEDMGVNSAGETVSYSATSILRTLGYLFDIEPYNARVEWSPSFEKLFNTKVRETVDELPEADPFRLRPRWFRNRK